MAMRDYFKIIPACFCILRDHNNVFMIRRANTGYMDGLYTIPAGHMEDNETPAQAAVRELKEETGVIVLARDVINRHVQCRRGTENGKPATRVDFFFEALYWQGEPTHIEPEKSDSSGWFNIYQIATRTDVVDHVRHAMELITFGDPYSEFGFPQEEQQALLPR